MSHTSLCIRGISFVDVIYFIWLYISQFKFHDIGSGYNKIYVINIGSITWFFNLNHFCYLVCSFIFHHWKANAYQKQTNFDKISQFVLWMKLIPTIGQFVDKFTLSIKRFMVANLNIEDVT